MTGIMGDLKVNEGAVKQAADSGYVTATYATTTNFAD
ncbi:hypothetical protein MCO_00314 [Bartonella sp. DB5-6]|nr:hypothetical protein MCO_00314 [Bartonella sp. DB5-6]